MRTKSDQFIESEIQKTLSQLSVRLKGACKLWVKVAAEMFKDQIRTRKAKDKAIYGELMQMESLAKECAPSEVSIKLIQKIQKLKGIVGVLCLSLLCLNFIQFSSIALRNRARGNSDQNQIARTIRTNWKKDNG